MDCVNNGYNIDIKYNVRESRDFQRRTFSGVERQILIFKERVRESKLIQLIKPIYDILDLVILD